MIIHYKYETTNIWGKPNNTVYIEIHTAETDVVAKCFVAWVNDETGAIELGEGTFIKKHGGMLGFRVISTSKHSPNVFSLEAKHLTHITEKEYYTAIGVL